MKKLLILSIFLAVIAPKTAHALVTNDEILSYTAMPLAVSNVCDVRGVQTDEVGDLVTYMDRANVPPDQFINVFRYVPVALVLNSGRQPDFVQWVGNEVDQGVVGDQLVLAMEQRLTTYGNHVVTASSFRYQPVRYYRHHRRYYRPIYDIAYEPNYIPAPIVRYVDYEMLEPYALIDEPVAVANVVDLGVPIARIGNFVLQLDLAGVAPVQTVELLRYAPAPLLAANYYGQPDFVQYVYDQRIGGVTGYGLVSAIDQQLPVYGVVSPQIDLAPPVYIAPSTYVPSYVSSYVAPVDPAWVPPTVRTQVASFAPGSFAAPQTVAPQVAPSIATTASPQVQRFLQQQGNAVVTNPQQARRELAQSVRAQRQAMRAQQGGVAPSVVAPSQISGMAPAMTAMRGNGRGRAMARNHAPVPTFAPSPVAAAQPSRIQRGHGRAMAMAHRNVAAAPSVTRERPHAQMMRQRAGRGQGHGQGRPQFAQPRAVAAPPQIQRAPVMARPQNVTHGGGHGRGRAMAQPAPAPAPAAVAPAAVAPQGPPAHGNGNGNGNGNKGHGKKGNR
ncbi:MAG TPA: hypothetical protein VG323_12770 [Thermoanaerobaculia bacterium]|nr:hypothetical protein [Thermoanaerobaculia bacterium]